MNQLKALITKNLPTLFVLLCVISVYGLSYYKQQVSLIHWMENRDEYVVEDVTALAVTDAYHWLKMARDVDAGNLGKGIDPLKGYPDLDEYTDSPSLLAYFISLASRFTDGDYYRGALLLTPLLASLFVFPLFLYFQSLGFGASAVLGGLIGTFSLAYYSRSAFGFVDTDILNTFFPILVSAFIMLIDKERSLRANLLLAVGAGVTMYMFNWWYQQPLFILVYLTFFATYLFLLRLSWQETCLILLLFTLLSGPHYVLLSITSLQNFLSAFFFPKSTGNVIWPEMLTTIIETQKNDLTVKLGRLHGFFPVVLAGFVGIIVLYFIRFKKMIPITPLILIGLWSLVGPRRFAMYLAPFIGIGVGVLIELLVMRLCSKVKSNQVTSQVIAIALMAVLFFSTTGHTGYNAMPRPIVPAATIQAFLDIKHIVPKHSAMFTWWDRGYPLMEIGEFATYNDGGLFSPTRTTLGAKAFLSPHQGELVSLLSYLEDHGFSALNEAIKNRNLSGDQMMHEVFNYPEAFQKENVYILYTDDMIGKFSAISTFGTWDFNTKKSIPILYEDLDCSSQNENILNCKDSQVDLHTGFIIYRTHKMPIKAALAVKDGYLVDRLNYSVKKGKYLQILMKQDQMIAVQVLDERLFKSNFNQQYLLGNHDPTYFEEVYNNFPVARVFKVKKASP